MGGALGRLGLLVLLAGAAVPVCHASAQSLEQTRQEEAWSDFRIGLAQDRKPGGAAAAFASYKRAAALGLGAAAFNVGVLLDAGLGVPRDARDAARWYAEAAVRGEPRGAYNLAELYRDGDGVPRNAAEAAAWFKAAAAHGVTAARKAAVPSHEAASAENAPVPSAPLDGEILRAAGQSIALVWRPAAASPVLFEAELATRGPEGRRRIWSGTTEITAVLTAVQAHPGAYAWRVLAVDIAGGHYAASRWVRFTVE